MPPRANRPATAGAVRPGMGGSAAATGAVPRPRSAGTTAEATAPWRAIAMATRDPCVFTC